MRKLILCAVLGGAVIIPRAVTAQDRDHDHDRDHGEHRYYDRRHHDYHEWNEHEDRAWHMYWEERHRPYAEWERAPDRDRERYWDWRHRHPDAVLKIDIR